MGRASNASRHHILVIADRLQQSAMEKGQAVSPNVMGAAELVFEKRGHTRPNPIATPELRRRRSGISVQHVCAGISC